MNIHDATETAYKNGYKAGYEAGYEAGKRDAMKDKVFNSDISTEEDWLRNAWKFSGEYDEMHLLR